MMKQNRSSQQKMKVIMNKNKEKIRTSGCAVGTVFGDMMESVEEIILPESKIKISWLYDLAKEISQINSLYLEVGAIHRKLFFV